MKNLLVISKDKEKVIIAFEKLDGGIEYSTYQKIDGGITDMPECDLGAVLASDNDIAEYSDYKLKEVL